MRAAELRSDRGHNVGADVIGFKSLETLSENDFIIYSFRYYINHSTGIFVIPWGQKYGRLYLTILRIVNKLK